MSARLNIQIAITTDSDSTFASALLMILDRWNNGERRFSLEEENYSAKISTSDSGSGEQQSNNSNEPLSDNDLMGFGKHKTCQLKDVPADYLLWLYGQPGADRKFPRHFEYIKKNFKALTREAADRVND